MNFERDPEAIKKFWSWFEKEKERIGLLVNTSDPFWACVLERLKAVDNGLWFEVSLPGEGEREFVITAESKMDLFPLVDAMVSEAPMVTGWKIVGLKPARGFDYKSRYEDVDLNPKKMFFQPLESSNFPEAIGVMVGVEGFTKEKERPILNGVLVILETGLGERSFSRDIQHVEACLLPAEPESEGFLPLAKLAEYLAWRKKRIKNSNGLT